jgi:hypothetical protein
MGALAEEWGQLAEVDKIWAEQGTSVHAALQLSDSTGLETDEQRVLYAKLQHKRAEFLQYWHANDDDKVIQEKRLWMHKGVFPVFSGQLDYARINGTRACILDYKTGWSKAPEPKDNHQLKSLAVLLKIEHPEIETVTLQVLSPYYTHYPYVMNAEGIADYETALRLLLFEAVNQKQEPVPGEYCKHCDGLLICPAVRKIAGSNFALMKPDKTGNLPVPLPEGEKGAKLLTEIALLEKFIEATRQHYKLLLRENPSAVPGWMLYPGKEIRFFTDAAKAAPILLETIGQEKFWQAVTISVTEVEKALPTGSANILEALVSKKQNAAQLGKSRKSK